MDQLLQRMEQSDQAGAEELVRAELAKKVQAGEIHLSLFPLVQRVENPPFINPHLPKMYRIIREFLPCLEADDLPPLLQLEINEYTRLPKSALLTKPARLPPTVAFAAIESAIRAADTEKVATLLLAFLTQQGKEDLARRLLLLGSGYLPPSLGHSLSCPTFILLEMIERRDQDPWPTLGTLAEYFCRGHFHTTPQLRTTALPAPAELERQLLRATSGDGIVNLHHTITRYAIERMRPLLSEAEYAHMLACWIDFLGTKEATPFTAPAATAAPADYASFYRSFAQRQTPPVLATLAGWLPTSTGRRRLGRYLIKGVCDQYQGSYNPHFLTGLGSALWVVDHYRERPALALNGLRQYLNYFFTSVSL
jgi:hypothetical protein